MTKQKSFKERIRARMDKTGESYSTARRRLIEKSETGARRKATATTASMIDRVSVGALTEATGRTWGQWFKLLDGWGAKDRKHPEIVRWLKAEHGVDGWWSQSITGAYEQERGLRAPGQRADGTYEVSASKSIATPMDGLFAAFENEELRSRWLGDFDLEIRTVRPGKSITALWEGGPTRVTIAFLDKGNGKCQVALAHQKLTDAATAEELRTFWREHFAHLKKMLED